MTDQKPAASASTQRIWQCQGCGQGHESPFKMGQCTNCGGWFQEVEYGER